MGNTGENGSGNWVLSLIISGEALDFSEIERQLALTPSDIRHKGEVLNKLPPVVSEQDVWIHELELHDNEGLDPKLHEFLEELARDKEFLKGLTEGCEVVLRLYVKSEYAQIFYRFVPDTLKRFADIGLPLEVSVVSWGRMRFEPTE